MPIAFLCPECGAALMFEDAQAGHTSRCSNCRTPVRVPQPVAAPVETPKPRREPEEVIKSTPKPRGWRRWRLPIEMACPKCQTQIAFKGTDAGRAGKCYNCGASVIVPAHSILPPAPARQVSSLEQGIGIGCGIVIVLGLVWLASVLFCGGLRP